MATQNRRAMTLWVQGLACGAALTLATPTALLVIGLLAPGLMAFAIDGQPGRPMARAVLLCGSAAIVEPLRRLWLGDHSLHEALSLLSDPSVVGLAWMACASGWLVAESAPVVVNLTLQAHAATRSAALRRTRAKYESEWGLPPLDETRILPPIRGIATVG